MRILILAHVSPDDLAAGRLALAEQRPRNLAIHHLKPRREDQAGSAGRVRQEGIEIGLGKDRAAPSGVVVVVNVEFEVSDERLIENSEYVQEEFAWDKEIGGCRSDIEVREVFEVNGRYISKEDILELVKV